jgi:phosphate starvation-inducible PhoH-like protein
LNIGADCAGWPGGATLPCALLLGTDADNATLGLRQFATAIGSRHTLILRHSFEPRDNARLAHLCGSLDEHLRSIERSLDVSLSRRNEFFRVEGAKPSAEHAMDLLRALYEQAQQPISEEQVQLALVEIGSQATTATRARGRAKSAAALASNNTEGEAASSGSVILRTRRSELTGRTPNQLTYLRNIVDHDVTFGIGPAGTGKTFLAVACAVDALERSAVQRIILTRPAVEAGERLGFLPGDLAQKVDPYLRPLYDALYDLMGAEKVAKAFEKGTLEIAPLAFMRGRTLNHAFVILDEAQNTTAEQMKMFLTRIGFGTKAVVTGDVSQIDLPRGTESGLIDAERVLRRVRGIATTYFTSADVLRHPLVARIVEAYDASRLDDA